MLRRKETGSDSGSTTIYATLFLLMKTSLGSFACVFTLIKSPLLSKKSFFDASTYKGLELLNTICSIIFFILLLLSKYGKNYIDNLSKRL